MENKIQYLLLGIIIAAISTLLIKQEKMAGEINKLTLVLENQVVQDPDMQDRIVSIDNSIGNYIGNEAAPVTITLFFDYECGYCQRFFEETMGRINEDFISKGTVKFVFRHYPLKLHKKALKASKMAVCANMQDEFMYMHKSILHNIEESFTLDKYMDWNLQEKIDIEELNTCIAQAEVARIINYDIQDAKKAGIIATPSFIINDRLIIGTKSYEYFRNIIMQELERTQN